MFEAIVRSNGWDVTAAHGDALNVALLVPESQRVLPGVLVKSLSDSLEGCFSFGVLTHTTNQCQTLDESFPFLPTGWQAQADYIGDQFILGPGPQAVPPSQQMGNAD